MAGDSARRSGSADAGGGLLATVGAWLSVTFLKPPKPKAPQPEEPEQRPLTEEEQVRQARMLDPTERKIGIVAAGLAFLISFGLTVPYMVDRHLTTTVKQAGTPKGTTCSQGFTYSKVGNQAAQCTGSVVYPVSHWLLLMVLLLVFAIAILLTLRVGRRIPLGFAMLVSGIAYESTVGLLGLLFMVPGAWLLFKAWKVSRPDAATGQVSQPRRGPGDRSPSGRPRPVGSPGSGQNKRYTPKAAPAKGKAPSAKAAPAKGRPKRAAPPAKGRPKRAAPPAS
jgi:hypothetical protein